MHVDCSPRLVWASPDTYPARGEQGPTRGKVLRNTGWSQRDEYSRLGLRQEQLQPGGDSGARAAADHGRRRRRRSLVGSVGGGSGGSCGGLWVASVRGLGGGVSWGGGWARDRAWDRAAASVCAVVPARAVV